MRVVLAMCILLAASLALADVLHLTDGTSREGKIVSESDKEVVVDFGRGGMSVQVRVPRARIVRIERKMAPADALMVDYVRRLADALNGDADSWYALGLWCQEQRVMKQKAREAFEHALALDPNHVKTRRLLGYVKVDDTWMTRDRAVRILAPDILSAVKERDLEARKDMEVARTEIAEKQQAIEKLEAQLKALEKANRDLLRRLASIPPPAPVREPSIIYRPYVIYRDRPRPTPHKGDGKGDGSHGSRDSREGNGTKKGTTKKSTKKTSP